MSHFTYLLILAACLLGTLPLETVLHVRVYRSGVGWRRRCCPWPSCSPAGTCSPSETGLWTYNGHYLVGVTLPGRLPLEELCFFIVIPICAVLTFEAVLSRRPAWAR